jgi:thiol:disulfide interchange protein
MHKFVNGSIIKRVGISFLLIFLCLVQGAFASPVTVELLNEESTVQPGHPFTVGVRFKLEDGWHTYGKESSDLGLAPEIQWTLPEDFQISDLEWPLAKRYKSETLVTFGYENEFVLLATVTPPSSLAVDSIPLSAKVLWVACDDNTCMPGEAEPTLTIPVSPLEPLEDLVNGAVIRYARGLIPPKIEKKPITDNAFHGGFGLALGLAFLGGLILNLMPCVLPVISFKILSFVKMSRQNRSLIFKHGLAFSFGVILSFWVLAGFILWLRSYGHVVGWGFQLQDPLFVAILASVIFLFSLSLFSLFEMGAGIASKAGSAHNKGEGLISSFFSGVLATTIATPCTGPFLGTAVGFAVTLSAPLALLIFTSLGLGMAMPYLLIGAFPSLIRFLPKPGNWMITFKEILGFVMLATVLWLVWVFVAQTSGMALFLLLVGFLLLSIGGWVYGKWGSPIRKRTTRIISMCIALVFLGLGGYTIYHASRDQTFVEAHDNHEIAMVDTHAEPVTWLRFSPERLQNLIDMGIPVFVDFTAKWCLICQANHFALTTPEVDNTFSDNGIVRMKADWTKNDPVITEELRKFGRNGVPLYVIYSPNGETTILPQVLTTDIVLDHIRTVKR